MGFTSSIDFLVTTSSFSSEATAYAPATGIVLVDIAEMVRWTKEGLFFKTSSEKHGACGQVEEPKPPPSPCPADGSA